jgi:hypothetical protein
VANREQKSSREKRKPKANVPKTPSAQAASAASFARPHKVANFKTGSGKKGG